jgi:hypothetical protein
VQFPEGLENTPFKFYELDFFPSLNWIFAGYKGSKNPVQTRKKIQLIKIGKRFSLSN